MSDWTLYPHPGKFEGEHISVPYFWDSVLDGGGDDEIGPWSFVKITTEERVKFPELGDTFGLAMMETSQGFVNVEWFETAEAYEDALQVAINNDDDSDDENEGY